MQTGLLSFQSLPDDLSLSIKKESQDSGSITQPAEKGTLPENSIFLSTLKQIANHPQRSRLPSSLFESLLMVQELSQTDIADSKPTIQGRCDGELELLNFLMNYALGLQNPEDENGPASTDTNGKVLPASLFKDFAPVALETHNNIPISDRIPRATELAADGEALFARLKNRLLNILNIAQNIQTSDSSILSSSQMEESDAATVKILPLLENRITEFLTTNPDARPPYPLTQTDATVSDKFQLPDLAINPESLDPDNGRKVQALLMNFLSFLRGRENGIENNPSASNVKATGTNHWQDVATDPPKTNTSFHISESAPEKIIPYPGDVHNGRDHASRGGLDFTQGMKQTGSADITTGGKDAAATHVKAAVVVPPSSSQNQQFDDQAARDLDVKAELPRGAAIETPPSETGTLSSEAEKDSRGSKDSGSTIKYADGFTRDDAGDKSTRVIIPENGDKTSLFSNNRVFENFSETASPAKNPEPAANFSGTGTLNQIVGKAALHLTNGQSELKLNLKPDFLGQLHMRIVTENHQVTLKISTEFFVVKDLIENNIHQLKADLQNHGLEINSLDVTVTKDSHQQGSGHQPADLLKAQKNTGAKSARDDLEQTELHEPNASGGENNSDNTIDYFV